MLSQECPDGIDEVLPAIRVDLFLNKATATPRKEAPPARLFEQNAARAARVPAGTILDLVDKLDPPALWEAHRVTHVLQEASVAAA